MQARESLACAGATNIDFMPVGNEHLALLGRWLAEPHVSKWWGDPVVELALIRDGRASGEADGYLCFVDGRPAGYVQAWEPRKFVDFEPWIADLEPGTIGVDIFVGPRDMLGRGVGVRLIEAFVARLRARGFDRIVIDPDAANARAIRAYEKAGFVRDRLVAAPDGKGETLLMMYKGPVEAIA